MNNQLIFVSVIIAAGMIIAGFVLSDGAPADDVIPANNVSVVDGVQIIELRAKGGYGPEKSIAQAGVPTVLRFITKGTFDCSSVVRIPSLDLTEILKPTGTLDVDLGVPEQGVFRGSCGMGMYPFEITFE